ncbi:MAG: transporter substrate-binding domain-containing protein, partial [Bacilli bacterium]|nr:transporter substrate-binding domain-containing protein [Bacilli bacterium]
MKKFTTLALTLGLVSTILSGCGGTSTSSSTSSQTKETLIVGMECGYAPFNWSEVSSTSTNYPIANSAGSYADGYDVQIAIKIANALDRELVIQKVDWEGLIPAVQSGSIDIIIAGMSDTEDRRVNVDFTSAYYTSTHVLVVRKDSAFASAASIDDFAGATIVGQKGT